jgi:hypothetical protein
VPGSPEYELKKREAEEANEILELRSMGIRTRLEDIHKANSSGLGGGRPKGNASDDRRREARLLELEKRIGVDKTEINSMKMQIDTTGWGVSKQQDAARRNRTFA